MVKNSCVKKIGNKISANSMAKKIVKMVAKARPNDENKGIKNAHISDSTTRNAPIKSALYNIVSTRRKSESSYVSEMGNMDKRISLLGTRNYRKVWFARVKSES
jgi:hypothetical protein